MFIDINTIGSEGLSFDALRPSSRARRTVRRASPTSMPVSKDRHAAPGGAELQPRARCDRAADVQPLPRDLSVGRPDGFRVEGLAARPDRSRTACRRTTKRRSSWLPKARSASKTWPPSSSTSIFPSSRSARRPARGSARRAERTGISALASADRRVDPRLARCFRSSESFKDS
jgi:hypothetical protein